MSMSLILLLAACGGGYVPMATGEVRIPGVRETLPLSESAGAQLSSLLQQAAKDLSCPEVSVSQSRTSAKVVRVIGCAKEALYLRVFEPLGFEVYSRPVYALSFVDLGTATPSLPALARHDTLRMLAIVNERGAADLECPRSRVVPEVTSLGRGIYVAVAEGCGRRATYVPAPMSDPLRLAGKVDAPEAATSFVPWDGSGGPW
jgi:hypothetical protein